MIESGPDGTALWRTEVVPEGIETGEAQVTMQAKLPVGGRVDAVSKPGALTIGGDRCRSRRACERRCASDVSLRDGRHERRIDEVVRLVDRDREGRPSRRRSTCTAARPSRLHRRRTRRPLDRQRRERQSGRDRGLIERRTRRSRGACRLARSVPWSRDAPLPLGERQPGGAAGTRVGRSRGPPHRSAPASRAGPRHRRGARASDRGRRSRRAR